MTINTQVLIDSLPQGKLSADNYRVEENPLPEIEDGQVLVRTEAFAITAGTRAGLQGSASYAGAPQTGIVMNGTGVGVVAQSRDAGLQEGDKVLGPTGWQSYAALRGKDLTRIPDGHNAIDYLGPLGVNGLTAYFGLLQVGRPQTGQTVMISAAAGSVGHLVGQMAKCVDTRVVGVCGSDAKAQILTDRLGFDACVNYKEDDFRQALKAATPDGVDVYASSFDNTGGDILGAALRRLNIGGRIACCGVVSQYDTVAITRNPVPGVFRDC